VGGKQNEAKYGETLKCGEKKAAMKPLNNSQYVNKGVCFKVVK